LDLARCFLIELPGVRDALTAFAIDGVAEAGIRLRLSCRIQLVAAARCETDGQGQKKGSPHRVPLDNFSYQSVCDLTVSFRTFLTLLY
jgi:hypothetical protein